MSQARRESELVYRIWIVAYRGRRPSSWRGQPRRRRLLQLADAACYSPRQADAFLEGFNSEMLRSPKKRWAVAVEVR